MNQKTIKIETITTPPRTVIRHLSVERNIICERYTVEGKVVVFHDVLLGDETGVKLEWDGFTDSPSAVNLLFWDVPLHPVNILITVDSKRLKLSFSLPRNEVEIC